MSRIFRQLLFVVCLSVLVFAQDFRKPQNIILLIGDGMGLNYVAANVLQDADSPFRDFKTIGLSITKTIDSLITDSAQGATTIATGYRTRKTFIAVDTSLQPLYSIFEQSKKLGLSTGVVVTDEISGATPMAFLVHDPSRYNKEKMIEKLLDSKVDIIIGGGKKYFLPDNDGGIRPDKRNIISELRTKGYKFYFSFDDLPEVEAYNKFYGILSDSGLPKASERNYSLGQLTDTALKQLSNNSIGFVLMVEGSQIDWAGHNNDAGYALSELKDFATAISSALRFAEKDGNTLVLVTADHETGGLAITAGNYDGSNMIIKFVDNHHTGGFVPVFAKGPGEELFNGIYGNYMIGRKIFRLLDPTYHFSQSDYLTH